MLIHELLSEGRSNARTGRELAAFYGCDLRAVTKEIERERRAGYPICATSTGGNLGYYLAADAQELANYCKRLNSRETELNKTRRALVGILSQMLVDQQKGKAWSYERPKDEPGKSCKSCSQ